MDFISKSESFEKLSTEELKAKAKELHTKIKNMYEVPEVDRTN